MVRGVQTLRSALVGMFCTVSAIPGLGAWTPKSSKKRYHLQSFPAGMIPGASMS